jgi:uncharacterized protein (TIGR02172 family)
MINESNKPLARGRTAEIFAWREGWVVKLFYPWVDAETIDYEAHMAALVQSSGLPVPAAGEIVRVNGRIGLLYERIEGLPMWPDGLAAAPWRIFRYARCTAELHAQVHDRSIASSFPIQRQRLMDKLHQAKALPNSLRAGVLAALQYLPDGDRLCHGDFHPANILLSGRGKIIIDWVDATLGNPLADVARTSVLVLGAAACQIQGTIQKTLVRMFHSAYLHHYFSLKPGGEEEYTRWLPVVAAARLSENIPELEAWLINQIELGLKID